MQKRMNSDIMVGSDGKVDGDIIAENIAVDGTLNGTATGKECIIIAAYGHVKADLSAPAVSIEKGAKFSGKIDMVES